MSDDELEDYMKTLVGSVLEERQETPPVVPETDDLPSLPGGISSIHDVALDSSEDDGGLSLTDYVPEDVITKQDNKGLVKPWMKFHRFNLVKTVEEVREVVDKALAHGRCALDLETEGFDNRIDFYEKWPQTKHKIVGYCLSIKGVGYYIPVRHRFNPIFNETDPNVPVEEVEAEIKRLCLASQPILTPEGRQEDPLGSSKFSVPPRVVIYFWNAKFDHEFLLPVTGIDFWHPASFEDGMLSKYVIYTDDDLGLKETAEKNLTIYDPDRLIDGKPAPCPYEMIRFEDLFDSKFKASERRFYNLYPRDGSDIVIYGCSDAICTELLCEAKGEWEHTRPNLKYDYKPVNKPIKDQSFTYKLEKQTTGAIRDLERQRVKINRAKVETIRERALKELDKIDTQIQNLATLKGWEGVFNPGSASQLSEFLFGERWLNITPKPEILEASKQYKTDASTLEKLLETNPDAPEILKWIVHRRQIDKIIGTYLTNMIENCDEKDQLRFKFQQTAATGRFTAPAGETDHGYSGVPPQGIPARDDPNKPDVAQALRDIFEARPGYVVVKVDYAGQELRIVSNISGEPVWINEFLYGTGDLHTITAKAFFGDHITKEHKIERNAGKIANFSLIYGGGTQAIMRATKCDKIEATRRKSNFDKSVPVFARWVKNQHEKVKKNKGVSNAFQRFIAIPDADIKPGDKDSKGREVDVKDVKKIRAACERKSTNYPIQSSGADIMKISLVKLLKEFTKRGWRYYNYKGLDDNGNPIIEYGDDSVRMILTVHDEIVFEIKPQRLEEALPLICEIMESPAKMVKWKVPLVVEPLVGLTWDAKHDWYKMRKGKEPIPEWLDGCVTVVPNDPETKAGSKETSAPAPVTAVANGSPKALSMPPSQQKTRTHVVTFALSHTYLTVRSVYTVGQIAWASRDDDSEGAPLLRLVDESGNTLIDPAEIKIPINPEKFKYLLQDHHLGLGAYKTTQETL